MKRLLALTALLLSAPTLAEPNDFARGRVVDTSDDSFVQRVSLPQDVYEWVSRPDLGDLRVFNAAREEVPYAIRRPETTAEYSPWQAFPLFPLPAAETGTVGDPKINIEVDAAGTIIAINGAPPASVAATGFLVDTSTLDRAATELMLDWHVRDSGDFVGRIRIEGSDDLDSWRALVGSTTIASLSRGDRNVRLDRVDLPGKKNRYLRISQLEGNGPLDITSVQLRHREQQLPQRQWREVAGSAIDDGYEFATGGRFPIDRVAVTQAGPNYLASVKLFSRPAPEEPWRSRGVHTFYRSTISGVTIEADPVRIAHRDQYWRVEFDGGELSSPILKFGWLPDEVVFLKQGAAPYVMAYGQAVLQGRQWPLSQLLSKLGNGDAMEKLARIPQARIAEPQELGGPDRLNPPAEPIDWQTIVLWAVLLLGVAVVGGFAYRLLRSA